MATATLVDSARLEQIYADLRRLIRELDPTLSDDDVEAALARTLYYAQRERGFKERVEKAKSDTTKPGR